jgi:hypothetical protein
VRRIDPRLTAQRAGEAGPRSGHHERQGTGIPNRDRRSRPARQLEAQRTDAEGGGRYSTGRRVRDQSRRDNRHDYEQSHWAITVYVRVAV